MATTGPTVTPGDLSPSVRTAFGWARAAAPPQTPVGSAALLFGVINAHAGSSEPEALMAHISRPLSDLLKAMAAVAPGHDFNAAAPALGDLPDLDDEGQIVVQQAVELASGFDAFKDGKVHVPHLFGAILTTAERRPVSALRAVLGDATAKASRDYRGYLDELTHDRSLRYADFLARHPLVTARPLPPLAEPFIGREEELEQIRTALGDGHVVSISGPRGSGRTALALQAASEIVDAYSGGIVYVDARSADAESAVQSPAGILIVDNADERTLERLGPSITGPAIVITRDHGREPNFDLGPVDSKSMQRLLRARVPGIAEDDLPDLLEVAFGLPSAVGLIAELLASGLSTAQIAAEAIALYEETSADVGDRFSPEAQAVEDRYSGRRPHERRALDAVALIDGTFSTAQAARAAETNTEGAEILLADLAAAQLVREDRGGWSMPDEVRAVARSRLSRALAVDRRRLVLLALAARHAVGLEAAEPPALAGLRSDEPSRTDDIGFAGDVEALCSVLIAHEVTPPISVGLFGEWGTGKSTFMRLMRDRIRGLQQEWAGRDDSPFCGRVKQITFNAWNYSDANLWASLVTKIFDGLAGADPEIPGDPALNRSERAAIVNALETAKATIAEKEVEHHEAARREAELTTRLEDIQTQERDAGERLGKISPAKVIEQARASENLRELGNDVLEEVRQADGGNTQQAITVARELRSTWGFAAHAARLLGTGRTVLLVLLTLVVVGGAGVAEALGVPVAGTALAIATWLGGLATLLRPAVGRARRAAAAGDQLLAGLREEEQAAVRREEAEVQRELAQLAAQRAQLDAELQDARSAAARAQREIEDIRSGRRISQFVEERAASAEYRQYLGLIALIRRDFDELTRLLLDGEDVDKPPFDRIILYIDDLDRCRAELVVQVLEAVHLLLALRLFVVVVGVDPRWLAESLKHHYIGQLGLEDGTAPSSTVEDWATTPQNYLEKIFQIPFALSPMGEDGFSRMMGKLFEVRAVERDEEQREGVVVEQAAVPETTGDETNGHAAAPPIAPAETPADPERTLELLRIWPAELEFLQGLGALSPTPRAANRLANTYRLIRVGQNVVTPVEFVSREGHGGQYRIALVLVAIVVGFSDIADDVLTRLCTGPHQAFGAFVEDLEPPADASQRTAAAYARLGTALKGIRENLDLPDDIALYRKWAPHVGRYSFEITTGSTPRRRA